MAPTVGDRTDLNTNSMGLVNQAFTDDDGHLRRERSQPDTPSHNNLAFPDENGGKSVVLAEVVDAGDLSPKDVVYGQAGNEPEQDKPVIRTQIVGALTAAMTHVIIGAIVALPSVTLSQLTDVNSGDLFLDTNQVGLYSSIVHIGAIIGSLLAGGMNLRLGQRVTLLITLPVLLLLWIALAFSTKVWLLLVIRAVLGAGQGFIGAASNNYVIEIAHSDIRGRLSGMTDTCRQLGFLLVYVIGTFGLTWRQISIACGIITTVPPFIGLCLLPNSPRWLVTRGRTEEAQEALAFYRGSSYNVKRELTNIVEQLEKTNSSQMGIVEQLKQMCAPEVYPRFILLTFLMFAVHFSGNIAIATFVVPIFQAAGTDMDPYTCAVLIGSVRVAAIITFLMFIDSVGHKPIFIISNIVCASCLFILGVFFFLQNNGYEVSSFSWVPLASLFVYTPFVCAIQAMASLLRGEVLPTPLRALGVSYLYVVFFMGTFASTQAFPEMIKTTGEQGIFWVFAASCIIMVAVVAFALPETKGLSLEEIDELFRNRSKANRTKSEGKVENFHTKVPSA
ncbi:facilitated trehalose transporter Tret1-like [Macrobrachium nipponense]|uniref:facilitated trehalose transporter Tret1-like n=1 Tax=Macrobrachium nipponense TaxID=159736 RepID=UPI0030C7B11C